MLHTAHTESDPNSILIRELSPLPTLMAIIAEGRKQVCATTNRKGNGKLLEKHSNLVHGQYFNKYYTRALLNLN